MPVLATPEYERRIYPITGDAVEMENIVASCAPCNRRKGDALPRQVGMRLLKQPRIPNPSVFIHVASPTIPTAWLQYLAA